MPNYCDYSMCVKGTKENIEEFIKVINAGYSYTTMEFDYNRHFYRVFESYYDEIEEMLDGTYQVVINGYCAWSVNSCMFENGYHKRIKEEYKDECRGTTVPIESERLNLDIEIFSSECGVGFQEHYIVRKGAIEVEECVDYYEYAICDFNTKEEAEEEFEIEITDEEWNSGEDYISRGGFDWDFTI